LALLNHLTLPVMRIRSLSYLLFAVSGAARLTDPISPMGHKKRPRMAAFDAP